MERQAHAGAQVRRWISLCAAAAAMAGCAAVPTTVPSPPAAPVVADASGRIAVPLHRIDARPGKAPVMVAATESSREEERDEDEERADEDEHEGGEEEGPEAHWLAEDLHADDRGQVRDDLYRQGLQDVAAMRTRAAASEGSRNAYGGNALTWNSIGPQTMNVPARISANGQRPGPNAGRTWDLAVSGQTAYAATDGGLWKTTDGGSHWKPLTDGMPSNPIGAVAVDPNDADKVYAGTGGSFGESAYTGVGIYRSSDGGATWEVVGGASLTGKAIRKIVFFGSNSFAVATTKGLFTTTDYGDTFSEVSINGALGRNVTDLRQVKNTLGDYYIGVSGVGLFRSTMFDFGSLENLWAPSHTGAPAAGSYGFVALDVARDGQTIYANVAGPFRLFKSVDNGATWTNITANATVNVPTVASWRQVKNCQCGYDQTVGVDPADANKVYMGFQDLWYSANGGTTWTNVTSSGTVAAPSSVEQVHVDHHALAFDPVASTGGTSGLWVGTDGGVWKSAGGTSSFTTKNGGFRTGLFYGISTGKGPQGNGYTYGGTQDNGTQARRPGMPPGTFDEWLGGDGSTTGTSWIDPKRSISDWGADYVTSDGGQTVDSAVTPGGCPQALSSVGPVFDPSQALVAYVPRNCSGTATIFKTVDGGTSYSVLVQIPGELIASMVMSPADTDRLYLGFNNGDIGRITQLSTSPQLAAGNFGKTKRAIVAVDDVDPLLVAVVYPGFTGKAWPDDTEHAYISTDGLDGLYLAGGVAGDRAQSLPDVPLMSAVFDSNSSPSSLIVATDGAVMRTADLGQTWQTLGTGLPGSTVTSLAIDTTVVPSVLKAGTYGRSIFQLSVPPAGGAEYGFQGTLESSTAGASRLLQVVPGAGTYQVVKVDRVDRTVWTFPAGDGLRGKIAKPLKRSDEYTIAMLVRLDDVTGYRRLIDTSDGALDEGLYVAEGKLNFFPGGIGSDPVIAAGRWVQVVMTRDRKGKVRAYVNGALQLSFQDTGNLAVVTTDFIRYLSDNTSACPCDENTGGQIARLRVFPKPLTPLQVKYLDRLPATGVPQVTSIQPNRVAANTTATINVFGSDFTPNSTVALSPDVEIRSVEYVSATQLRVKAGLLDTAPGTKAVSVTTDLGSGSCGCELTVE